jgi:hypothetical protein
LHQKWTSLELVRADEPVAGMKKSRRHEVRINRIRVGRLTAETDAAAPPRPRARVDEFVHPPSRTRDLVLNALLRPSVQARADSDSNRKNGSAPLPGRAAVLLLEVVVDLIRQRHDVVNGVAELL